MSFLIVDRLSAHGLVLLFHYASSGLDKYISYCFKPLPLVIMPLFKSINSPMCVCVFATRGNGTEYFVYRINIDTN